MATGKVIQIAAGRFHSLALLDDGTVRGWGRNDDGQRENQNFLFPIKKALPVSEEPPLLSISIMPSLINQQFGGYKQKYLKYKQKYIQLKNDLNN